MDRFPCHGIMRVTVDENDRTSAVRVRVQHHVVHAEYLEINVPEDIKKFVEEHKMRPASEVRSLTSIAEQN